MNYVVDFLHSIMNGLNGISLPLLGFTNLSLWDFIVGMIICGFVYTLVRLLFEHKGGSD